MKKFLFIFLFISSVTALIAQPANDNCAGATNLGTLPTPGACTAGLQNGTPTTLNNQSTVGATSPNPYTYQANCGGVAANDMAAPALDTWYVFTASGTTVNINITGFPNGNVALYQGTCASLGGRGCALIPAGGSGTLTVTQINIGTTYYIQVSGNTAAATDNNFTLAVDNDIDCNNCLTNSTLTATPQPVNGMYQPGQVVHFCYQITGYTHQNTNWLHGVQVSFGTGWNGISGQSGAASCSGSGTWGWFNSCTSTATGSTFGQGFYYDDLPSFFTPAGNPGDNLGDNCATTGTTWNFCWNLTVKAACTPGSDLSITINTSGDGESGSWSSAGCSGDNATNFNAQGACCPPGLTIPSQVTCNGGSNGSITATPVGANGPYNYSWTGPAGYTSTTNGAAGANTISGLAAGTYTVNITDVSLCLQTATVTVTQPAAMNATITPTQPSCAGTGSINITAVTGGATPYDFSIDGGVTYIGNNVTTYNATGLVAGTYTVTIRDNNNCIKTFPVTVLTAAGSVTTSFTPPTAQCLTGNSFSLTAATAGNPGGTTYTWVWGDASANSVGTSATHSYAAAGTYTISLTATAGGCTNTYTATATVNPMPANPTLSPTQPTCGNSNGQINVTAPLGMTYSLNSAAGPYAAGTSFTGLAPGTYTVYVHTGTVPACQSSNTIVLTNQPGPTSVVITPTAANCGLSNGQISIGAVTGGTGPYTYNITSAAGPYTGTTSYTALAAGSYTVYIKDANGCLYNQATAIGNVAGPTATVTPAQTNCSPNTGSISITGVSGGAGGYTYSFNNGGTFGAATTANSLGVGTYTVIVKDGAGCLFTTNVNVTVVASPTNITYVNTAANCGLSNGQIGATGVGGQAPYTFTLNGGTSHVGNPSTTYTGLAAGTYTLLITDNRGCTYTNTTTIANTSSPTASITTQAPVSCNGGNDGSVTVAGAGGSGGFTYTINPGGTTNVTGTFTGLTAQAYTVTVTDAATCQTTQNVTITQPPVVTGSITAQTNVLCNGASTGSVTVAGAGGNGGFTYSLNGGAFQASGTFGGLAASSYTVTVKDSKGCTVTVPVTITQPTAITLVLSSTNANCTAANGTATVTPSGGAGGYGYSWAPSGGTGATTIGVVGGTYTVTVTDANGCVKTGNTAIAITPGGTSAVSVVSQVTCNGANNGSLTASTTATAATSYTYSWAPSGGTAQTATGLAPGTYTVTVTDNFGCISTANAAITQPIALGVTLTTVNVSCNGGSDGVINANVTGGTTPYSYAWNPGVAITPSVSGLSAGSYTCTVTDGHSCTATANVAITQPTVLAITPVVTSSHCNQADGAISVTGSGGAGGFTFSINNGAFQASGNFTGLVATTYTITIKDVNLCTKSFPVTVTDIAGATASIPTHTDVLCNGGSTGSATAQVVGGAGPFSYTWSNGQLTQTATNLPQGIYTVTILDQATGCTASAGVTITQPTPLVVNASGTDPLCNAGTNGTASAAANGGTPAAGPTYSFSWSTLPAQNTANATGLGAGTYNVIVTDANGCTATTSVILNNPALMTVSIVKVDLSCFNVCTGSAAATVTNGTSPILYSWTGAQTTPTASGLCAGGYTVNTTDFNGCTATANVTINQPTQLTASITNQVNVDCSGNTNGSATVTAGGATPAYTYSWTSGGTNAVETGLGVGPYTVTVTDSKNCSVTVPVTITEPNPMTLTVTGTNLKCFNDNSGTATANFGGGTPGYSFLWQPSLANVFNPTGLPAGTHSVTVTDTMGCFISGTITLTQPAQLTAVTDTVHSNCLQSNGYADVAAAGGSQPFSYAWSNGATTAVNSGIPANLYSVTVTDANLCSVTVTANVNDLAAPVTLITGHTDITCFGANNGTASASVTGGATPYQSVQWLNTGILGTSATGLPPGIQSIKVVDSAGCISSASVTIVEPPHLVTAITNIVHVSCFGGNDGSADVLSNGGTAPTTLVWTPSGQITSTASNLIAGTYSVTVTDNNGCTSTSNVTINQPAPLIVTGTPGGVNVSCNGSNDGTITISVGGGTPAYNYVWTPGTNALGNVLNSPVATNLSPASYTVTVTDTKGCTAFASYSITEPAPLVVTPSSTNSSCGLANGTSSVSVTGGTPNAVAPFYFYSWTGSASSTSTASSLAAGSYTCTVTDNHGCTMPGTAAVVDQPGPQNISVYSSPAKCFGSADGTVFVHDTLGTGPLTITWTNSGGGSVAIHAPVLINSIDSVNGVSTGLYNVHVADANGCFFNTTVNVLQPTPLMIPVSLPQTMCAGGLASQQVLVNASANGGTAPYTFVWNLDGSVLAGATTNQVVTNFNNTTNASITHTYSVTVTDANGCTNSSAPATVLVYPVIDPSTTPVMGCDGASVIMQASATGGNGGPYTYSWLNNGTPGPTQSLPLVYNGTVPTPYNYYIKFSVNDQNNCTVTAVDSVAVNVYPKPQAGILAVNREGCTDLTVTFAGSAGGAGFVGSTFDWDFGDGTGTSTTQNPIYTYVNNSAVNDTFNIQLTVTTGQGCTDVATNLDYVVVYPRPIAAFSANPSTTSTLYPDVNFVNASQGANAFAWDFGDPTSAINASTLLNPMHTYENSGYYTITLTATSSQGCMDDAQVTIYVEPDYALYVPNAFSPNQDGKNEVFLPKGIGINEDKYQLYIFDRWGEMIFQSNNFNTGWDGKAKGGAEPVQEDVYIYKIIVFDLLNNKHNLVGHVTVVR